jgi:S-adenosyl-L-methionine hydrolase (adenosine-forming)
MIITLLTDFGTADGYVAELKGALLRRVPTAVLVDVAHDLAPGDVAAAGYVLGRTWGAFPDGTVHLAVVDPGVGTPRRALAAVVGGHRFVAPDNGLLTPVLEGRASEIVALEVPPGASPTFHGRDVFAPAAARLAAGEPLGALGHAVLDPVRLVPASLERRGGDLLGAVVHVDRFGTLVTNLPEGRVAPGAPVRIGVYDLVLRRTFGDVAPGDPVAYVGSGGTIEIAVRGQRADAALGLTRGAEVRATARTGSA